MTALKSAFEEMGKAIKCLALESPGPVYDDIAARWTKLLEESVREKVGMTDAPKPCAGCANLYFKCACSTTIDIDDAPWEEGKCPSYKPRTVK